jgi:hypothetical protein
MEFGLSLQSRFTSGRGSPNGVYGELSDLPIQPLACRARCLVGTCLWQNAHFVQRLDVFNHPHVFSLLSFWSVADFKFNFVAFLECLESFRANAFPVGENVFVAFVRGYKSVSLIRAKPFHNAVHLVLVPSDRALAGRFLAVVW